jgi:hypothetical protein
VPEVDQKILTYVETALRKNPEIQLQDLYERAKKVIPSVKKLSKRQFNARYPLQVKRRRALAEKAKGTVKKKASSPKARRSRKVPAASGEPRDRVRNVFLKFATDIAAAEERKDLVKVLAGVDQYVDEVLRSVPSS